jgi:hypothetical protein
MSAEAITQTIVEFDRRRNNGVEVVLWWVKDTLTTYVTVIDEGSGTFAKHPVPDGVNPMDVFDRPGAFAEEQIAEGL